MRLQGRGWRRIIQALCTPCCVDACGCSGVHLILFHGCNGQLPRRLRLGELNRLDPRVGHDRMRVTGGSLECTDSHLRWCCRVQSPRRWTGQRFSDKAERRPASRQTHSTVLMLIRGLRAFDQNGREVRRDSAGVHLHVHHATVMIRLPSNVPRNTVRGDARRRSKFSSIVATL